jgi:ornithine carbamoyltransferase
MTPDEVGATLALSAKMKQGRGRGEARPLEGQIWALMFSKSSTRTRVSFEVGIRELGGQSLFLAANEIQIGRGEPMRDTARVLGRMVHGAVIRTFAQSDVEEFASLSGVPTINALTDDEHPCQILADLFTIEEKIGSVQDKVVAFIGDGDCNVARSWLWAARHLGFEMRVVAPPHFQPPADFMRELDAPNVRVGADVAEGLRGADVVYTDVWVSMGKEEETAYRIAQLGPYQVNERAMSHAKPDALVMHCLPAYRGKEISEGLFDAHAGTIFDQAENRLHAQKAILTLMQEARS